MTPTFLVIEDDEVTRQQFTDVLQAEDYAVVSFGDGDAAIERLGAMPVSAVLLDLHLPGRGGLSCLERIRSIPSCADIPVVVITGDYFIDDSVSRQLDALGARIYFKPVWGDELAQLARELLAAEPS